MKSGSPSKFISGYVLPTIILMCGFIPTHIAEAQGNFVDPPQIVTINITPPGDITSSGTLGSSTISTYSLQVGNAFTGDLDVEATGTLGCSQLSKINSFELVVNTFGGGNVVATVIFDGSTRGAQDVFSGDTDGDAITRDVTFSVGISDNWDPSTNCSIAISWILKTEGGGGGPILRPGGN